MTQPAPHSQIEPLAPGELITIYGTYLGVSPPADSRTSILIDGLAAPLLFVSGEQVNAVVPFSVAASAPSELRI